MKLAIEYCKLARTIYGEGYIPLHRPVFSNEEKENLLSCIDSNFVSSVGEFVDEFEVLFANFVGAKRAVACVNGTAGLHASLHILGVRPNTLVLTQALTFVATANAIQYCQADPVFIDVDLDTMGMSPLALKNWLMENSVSKNGKLIFKKNGKEISACLPMHTFGLPCRIREIAKICNEFGLILIEDAAEALGSTNSADYLGTFGNVGTFSFNGNKIITTGGGGMVVTNDNTIADELKSLTTTAKVPHEYEYFHSRLAFNYRLPNINAAIGVAQMDKLPFFLKRKEEISNIYMEFFEDCNVKYARPIRDSKANNWLNAIVLKNRKERDQFLKFTNRHEVMTRPIWQLMNDLPMYQNCEHDGLRNSKWLVDRVVNIPSSVPN